MLINIDEASRILGVSKDTLRNWDSTGKLKSVRTVGGHRRYERDNLLEMVKISGDDKIAGHNQNDHTVVYAYVCGDILHKGHLHHLRSSNSIGTFLIVGVLTDEAVMEKKSKPVMCFEERIDLIKELKMVDLAVPQYTYSPYENLKNLKPDILAESTSHSKELISQGENLMKKIGGKVVVFSYYPDQSSTKIRNKIKEQNK